MSRYRLKKDDDRMSAPRAYDLTDPVEIRRLHAELRGYMRVSLTDGTDTEGRAHAYAALCELVRMDDAAAARQREIDRIAHARPSGDQTYR